MSISTFPAINNVQIIEIFVKECYNAKTTILQNTKYLSNYCKRQNKYYEFQQSKIRMQFC